MKKRITLILFLLLLAGVSIGFYISTEKPNEIAEKIIVNHTEQKDTKKDADEYNIEMEETIETEDDKTTEQFKSFVEDAVQGTIDFFRNKELKIVAIGDSLTQGVGDSTGNGGYVAILNQIINDKKEIASFENYGKRGNRTDQLLERLEQPEIAASISNADIIFITIGANDVMKVAKENITNLSMDDFGNEKSRYNARLHRIFQSMNDLNPESDIYLLGFYNPFEKYFPEIKELDMIVDNWNQESRTVTDVYDNVTFIPTKDLFDEPDMDLFSDDNFHPNYLGYERIAERVLDYLTKQEG